MQQPPLSQSVLENTVEIWRDILGYEGRYQVSDEGRVRSLDRRVRLWTLQGGEQFVKKAGRVLTPGVLSTGHLYVFLGRGNRRAVHRLVLETFEGPCPAGMECLHGPDANPANNHRNNLRWGTRSENLKDDYVRGVRTPMAYL